MGWGECRGVFVCVGVCRVQVTELSTLVTSVQKNADQVEKNILRAEDLLDEVSLTYIHIHSQCANALKMESFIFSSLSSFMPTSSFRFTSLLFIHSFLLLRLIHSFIPSFIHSFIHFSSLLFIHSFSFIHSFIHSLLFSSLLSPLCNSYLVIKV